MAHVITVDTNIWVSAFITPQGHPARLLQYWRADLFDVVISLPLLAELADVLARPRLQTKYRYSSDEMAHYLHHISELAIMVELPGVLELSRDPDDNMVLETAVIRQATHLVSRDEDMTRDVNVASYLQQHGITVMTIQRFLALISQDEKGKE